MDLTMLRVILLPYRTVTETVMYVNFSALFGSASSCDVEIVDPLDLSKKTTQAPSPTEPLYNVTVV